MKDEIEKQIYRQFAIEQMERYLQADPIEAWMIIDSLIMYINNYVEKDHEIKRSLSGGNSRT